MSDTINGRTSMRIETTEMPVSKRKIIDISMEDPTRPGTFKFIGVAWEQLGEPGVYHLHDLVKGGHPLRLTHRDVLDWAWTACGLPAMSE